MNKKVIFYLSLSITLILSLIFIFSIIEFAQVWYQDLSSANSGFVEDEFKTFAIKWFSINLIIIILELLLLAGLIIVCWYVHNSELKSENKSVAVSSDRKEKYTQVKREKLLQKLKKLEENQNIN